MNTVLSCEFYNLTAYLMVCFLHPGGFLLSFFGTLPFSLLSVFEALAWVWLFASYSPPASVITQRGTFVLSLNITFMNISRKEFQILEVVQTFVFLYHSVFELTFIPRLKTVGFPVRKICKQYEWVVTFSVVTVWLQFVLEPTSIIPTKWKDSNACSNFC